MLVLQCMPRPPKPTPAELKLRQDNDALRTVIVRLKRELENKQGAISRLETLLCERLTRNDDLTATVDRLREQNRKLDAENERLAEMAKLEPQLQQATG